MKNDALIEKLRTIFVSWDIFNLRITPIERLVYGFVSLALTAVVGYLIFLAVRSPQ